MATENRLQFFFKFVTQKIEENYKEWILRKLL